MVILFIACNTNRVDMMSGINKITEALREFRDERNWAQFHNPKDLAIALSIEANELLEVFLWKAAEDAELGRVKEELADVFAFAFLLADRYGLDVQKIIEEKIEKNKLKYPVDKSRGSASKYTEL
jgi:NTP pyrophosphatase (non-canonical NTP hydrolase)